MKDPLEYTEEELNQLSTEELKELRLKSLDNEDKYFNEQWTKKILINSLYGATGNKFFSLYNRDFASSITANGRVFIQQTANRIRERLQELCPWDKDFWIYSDTDSVADTLVKTDQGSVHFSELYDSQNTKEIEYKPGKFFKEVKDLKALSVSKDLELEYKPIKYVMKHTVKKRLFKIKCNGKEVIITNDHSIMVKRDDELIEVKPFELTQLFNTDSLIIANEDSLGFYSTRNFEIEDLGVQEETVYDIEVEDNHNFFGNNILLHNSVYYTVEPLVDKYLESHPNADIEELTNFCDSLAKKVIQPIIDQSINDIAERFNVKDPSRMKAKVEVICDVMINCAKKKYYARVRDDEGVRFPLDNPHIKIMGLELAKSTTPQWVKDTIAEAIPILFDKGEAELKQWIRTVKENYTKAPLVDIAQIGKTNSLDYKLSDKGIPIGARIAIVYNNFVKANRLEGSFSLIEEREKFKYLRLIKNNPFNSDACAFMDKAFAEEYLRPYIDYDTMFEKTFLSSLDLMCSCMGYDVFEKVITLDLW